MYAMGVFPRIVTAAGGGYHGSQSASSGDEPVQFEAVFVSRCRFWAARDVTRKEGRSEIGYQTNECLTSLTTEMMVGLLGFCCQIPHEFARKRRFQGLCFSTIALHGALEGARLTTSAQ